MINEIPKEQKQYVFQEVQIMESFTHPNLITYHGHQLNPETKELFIFMELFPFSLSQYIEKRKMLNQYFTKIEIKILSIEILNGLSFLHQNQIIHRDLKPENILIDCTTDERICKVKISDFGVCQTPRSMEEMKIRVGTETFMAPEVIGNAQFSVKSDIYAFGVLLKILLQISYLESNDFFQLAQLCLNFNPNDRPCAQSLLLMINQSCNAQQFC